MKLLFNLFKFVAVLPLLLFMSDCSSGSAFRQTSEFNYADILREKSSHGEGNTVLLTAENGETYSASITPDEKYLFYSNNKEGNFDIYLRDLNDVSVIPFIKSATNQTGNAISPNGEYLLYIDDEIDPSPLIQYK